MLSLGIETIRVRLSDIHNPYKPNWTESFVRLQCWKLTKYDKVCWIDSDTIQLQNCDELLSLPIAPDGVACAVDHVHFPAENEPVGFRMIQAGVLVLRPSIDMYNAVSAQLGKIPSADGSDQGFLTSFFALNSFESVIFLSSAYNYGKRGLHRHKEYDLRKIKILHFVGHPKPWNGGELGYEVLQSLWEMIPV